VADRRAAAHDYLRRGWREQAERLRGEADALSSYR
jgi:hypothetical protein